MIKTLWLTLWLGSAWLMYGFVDNPSLIGIGIASFMTATIFLIPITLAAALLLILYNLLTNACSAITQHRKSK